MLWQQVTVSCPPDLPQLLSIGFFCFLSHLGLNQTKLNHTLLCPLSQGWIYVPKKSFPVYLSIWYTLPGFWRILTPSEEYSHLRDIFEKHFTSVSSTFVLQQQKKRPILLLDQSSELRKALQSNTDITIKTGYISNVVHFLHALWMVAMCWFTTYYSNNTDDSIIDMNNSNGMDKNSTKTYRYVEPNSFTQIFQCGGK